MRRRIPTPLRLARLLLLAILCFAMGGFLLSQGLDAESPARDLLRTLLEEVRDPRWGLVYVLMAYAIGTLVFAPITALFIGTSLAVGTWRGFAYCLLGGLFSASLAYVVGRHLGTRLVARLNSRRLDIIRHQVATRPIRAVLVARFLPVGNFTLINLVLGGFRVRYSAFLVGNVLGMLPGVLAITVFKELLENALKSPDWPHLAVLAVGAVSLVVGLFLLVRRVARRSLLAGPEREIPPDGSNGH